MPAQTPQEELLNRKGVKQTQAAWQRPSACISHVFKKLLVPNPRPDRIIWKTSDTWTLPPEVLMQMVGTGYGDGRDYSRCGSQR